MKQNFPAGWSGTWHVKKRKKNNRRWHSLSLGYCENSGTSAVGSPYCIPVLWNKEATHLCSAASVRSDRRSWTLPLWSVIQKRELLSLEVANAKFYMYLNKKLIYRFLSKFMSSLPINFLHLLQLNPSPLSVPSLAISMWHFLWK